MSNYNYYKKAIDVLGELCDPGSRIMYHTMKLIGRKEIIAWFRGFKPTPEQCGENRDFDAFLECWMVNMHKGLRQIDMFKNGHYDMIMYHAWMMAKNLNDTFEEIVKPSLKVKRKIEH